MIGYAVGVGRKETGGGEVVDKGPAWSVGLWGGRADGALNGL